MPEVQVNTAPANPDSDPKYVEAMVAKAEGREPNADAAQTIEGEQLILGKFKSQEDLAKAYSELEKKLGAKPPTTPEAKPADPAVKVEEGTPPAKPEDAAKALEGAGLDYTAFSAEFAEKGELSADSYAKLEKSGIPRNMVDAYIAGQQALVTQQRNEVFQVAGGEQNYASAVEWAKTNMTTEEKASFNSVVNGGDMNATKLAVQGLMARYQAAEGREPDLTGGSTHTGDADGYSSWAEVMRDMAKPEYNSDPAYRKKVENKVARSSI